jgi:hypothetical protein
MLLEIFRLAVGLAVLVFHRKIAEFTLAQERALAVLFWQRGFRLPQFSISTETSYNIYFGVGVSICILQFVRIWTLLPHA